MLIKNQQDFWSGLMFAGIGAFFAFISVTKYDVGTAARMGPGYFPLALGVLLLILGAIVSLTALKGEHDEEFNVGKFDWDILVLFIGSILLFGLMMDHLGIYVSIVFLVIFSSLASHEFNLNIAIGNAIFLLIFTYLAFVKGLGLIFPLYPIAWSEWSTTAQIFIPIAVLIGLAVLARKLKKGRA